MKHNNPSATDSCKPSHLQDPPGTEHISSYFGSRGGKSSFADIRARAWAPSQVRQTEVLA